MIVTRLCIAAILLTVSTAIAADTHCTAQERVIFSCSIGKKIVSVCASRQLTPSSGYMQYRFGRKDALELALPDPPAHPRKVVKAGTLMFSGGGGAYLRFMRGQYSYVVYTAIGRGWGEKEGVVVEKNGEVSANLSCKSAATSELGPDLYKEAGLPEDAQGFDLPEER
jgi:hypothetical protein